MDERNVAIGLRAAGSGDGGPNADGSSSRNQDLLRGCNGDGLSLSDASLSEESVGVRMIG